MRRRGTIISSFAEWMNIIDHYGNKKIMKKVLNPSERAKLDNASAGVFLNISIEDMMNALVELGEMASEQDDAIVELGELIEEG